MSLAFMLSIYNDQSNDLFCLKNIYRLGFAGIPASDDGRPSQRFCGEGIGGAAHSCMDRAAKNICFFC